MNLFKACCCAEKQQDKPPQRSSVKSIKLKRTEYKVHVKSPASQPFNMADKYKGEQLHNLPNGNGQMMYMNGDYYRGQWILGQKQGRGLHIYHEKGYRYEGEWKANLPNGQGKLSFDDGSYYIGEFKDNNKHGKGEYYDAEKKLNYEQYYQNGNFKKQHVKQNGVSRSREQEFPTLVLDKQRFNSQDLQIFQKQNPEIKELQVNYLTKYYSICKIIKLNFITKNIKQWNGGEVNEFLQAIGLLRCKQIFYKNKVKGRNLITITEKQMRDDLKLKLGDRKRLLYYCRFLAEIYNEQKKKKEKPSSKKYISDKYKRSSHKNSSSDRSKDKFITAFIDEEDIIEEQNQYGSQKDESFGNSQIFMKNSEQKSNLKLKQFKNQNYETQQWNNYNSHQIQSMTANYRKQIEQSNQIQAQSENQNDWASKKTFSDTTPKSIKNLSNRKKSSENTNQDRLNNNLIQRSRIKSQLSGLQDLNNHKQPYKNDEYLASIRKRTSSSSSSLSSNSQISEIQQLKRKRTTVGRKEGGMEIRQLYEFLRQRGNLQFIIKQRQIELLDLIGQGGYGKVYKGKYMSCPVAVKDYIKTGRHQIQQDFLKQLQILSDLKHPNIVLYMGICITTDKYQLVTQYLQSGSLFDQIHKKNKRFTRQQLMDIIDDIVKGMVYLHNMKNIMHRDLKSSNVLLDQDWKVKLCDFGLSGHKKKSKKKSSGRIGTYQWMAPQVMKKQQMDYFSDVYSFGVILWQLLTYKIPYQGYTQQQIIGQVGYDQNYKLKLPEWDIQWQADDLIVLLMNECLNRIPAQRPTFIEIQSKLNEYFEKIEELKEKSKSA